LPQIKEFPLIKNLLDLQNLREKFTLADFADLRDEKNPSIFFNLWQKNNSCQFVKFVANFLIS